MLPHARSCDVVSIPEYAECDFEQIRAHAAASIGPFDTLSIYYILLTILMYMYHTNVHVPY